MNAMKTTLLLGLLSGLLIIVAVPSPESGV
jgi:hypothetical protein